MVAWMADYLAVPMADCLVELMAASMAHWTADPRADLKVGRMEPTKAGR